MLTTMEENKMTKKKATKAKSSFRRKVCEFCGLDRKDCKKDPLSQTWVCSICQTGEPGKVK